MGKDDKHQRKQRNETMAHQIRTSPRLRLRQSASRKVYSRVGANLVLVRIKQCFVFALDTSKLNKLDTCIPESVDQFLHKRRCPLVLLHSADRSRREAAGIRYVDAVNQETSLQKCERFGSDEHTRKS